MITTTSKAPAKPVRLKGSTVSYPVLGIYTSVGRVVLFRNNLGDGIVVVQGTGDLPVGDQGSYDLSLYVKYDEAVTIQNS